MTLALNACLDSIMKSNGSSSRKIIRGQCETSRNAESAAVLPEEITLKGYKSNSSQAFFSDHFSVIPPKSWLHLFTEMLRTHLLFCNSSFANKGQPWQLFLHIAHLSFLFREFCWHLTDWPSGPTFSNAAELQDISIHKITLGITNVTGGLKLQLKTLYHSFKYTMIDTTIFWPKFHNNILLNSEFESPVQDLVNPLCNKRLH